MKKILLFGLAATSLAIGTETAKAADVICGSYYGVRVCTPIRRTGPTRPTTHPTMTARATPTTVKVGGSVRLWMGPKRGQNGFTSGELVRFFDIYKGKTSEMIGIQDTIKGGIARWSREYLSMPGVDPTGIHHLCVMGERSGKLACVKVTVVWGSGTGADDSYGGVAGDEYKGVTTDSQPTTTVVPIPTTASTVAPVPSTPPTTSGGYSPPVAG